MGALASRTSYHTQARTHKHTDQAHTHINTIQMGHSMRLVSAVFVLVLLLAATEMGPMGVEARSKSSKAVQERTCEAASGKFKGLCFSFTNCKHTCRKEQFNGGKCRGFRRRCMCNKKC